MLLYNSKIFKRCFYFTGRHWYRNLLKIPNYFKQLHFLIRNGYDSYAEYETFAWFIMTMKSILTNYSKNHCGCPIVKPDAVLGAIKVTGEVDEKAWDDIINKMLSLLDDMDENNPKYINPYLGSSSINREEFLQWEIQCNTLRDNAKNDFFTLFNKYFYDLWD